MGDSIFVAAREVVQGVEFAKSKILKVLNLLLSRCESSKENMSKA
jgi:hypothetical protein